MAGRPLTLPPSRAFCNLLLPTQLFATTDKQKPQELELLSALGLGLKAKRQPSWEAGAWVQGANIGRGGRGPG